MPITFTDIQSKSDNAEVDSSHDDFRGKEEYYITIYLLSTADIYGD